MRDAQTHPFALLHRKMEEGAVENPIEQRPETDAELWRALQADHSVGMGALYDRYARLVYGLALAVLTNPQDAEDLTQEVFLALCRKCDYDPARGSLSAFLVTLTRSRAVDKLRARGRQGKLIQGWKADGAWDRVSCTPLEAISVAEGAQRVRDALTRLPQTQRQVLEMAYYRGLTQAEIAVTLKAPLGTVKSWARKGLLTLKLALQDLVG